MVYQILTDPEARAGDAGDDLPSSGHLREPVLLVENLLRGMNGTIYDSSSLYNYTSNLGQNLSMRLASLATSLPTIMLALYRAGVSTHSTQTAVTRSNYIYSAIYNGKLDASTTFDISPFVTAASSTPTLMPPSTASFSMARCRCFAIGNYQWHRPDKQRPPPRPKLLF